MFFLGFFGILGFVGFFLTMSFLSPTSIAVIGASAEPLKVGHEILKNLVQEFKGVIIPVNPKHDKILGKSCVTSIREAKPRPDIAVIAIPAAFVPSVLEECAEIGIRNAVIVSAGFGETGTEEGRDLERRVKDIATKASMTLIGPNCLGILLPHVGANASFARRLPHPGNIAFISQSGAMAVAMFDEFEDRKLGLSFAVSMGNKAVTDECDLLAIASKDENTKIIGLYLESIVDGERFLDTASILTKRKPRSAGKPIVLLKSGVSSKGARAVSSHTGALAGSDAAVEAACRQSGIIRARDSEEFLDTLAALSLLPPLPTRRIGILTNAGGPGILATDAAQREGLELAELHEETKDALRKHLPATASVSNPVDVIGDAKADRYETALHALARDAAVDAVIIILTRQVMTEVTKTAEAIVRASKMNRLIPFASVFMGGNSVEEGRNILHGANLPTFESPSDVMRALRNLREATKTQGRKREMRKVVQKKLKQSRFLPDATKGLLPEESLTSLFAHYGIPLPLSRLARTADEAVSSAREIGVPVVLKVSSPHILHKTDVGGIRVNLEKAEEIRTAFTEIQQNVRKNAPTASIRGILVQQYLPLGSEFIVGCMRDATFGHLLMVGWGGIYTEILRDRTFRIAPITERDAYEMLQDLKSWELLLGARGKERLDIDGLAGLLLSISNLVTENPHITDIDLNPVIVRSDGVQVADAKVIVG